MDIADMCTVNGSPINGGLPFSSIEDVSKDPAIKGLPMPPMPAMTHSTNMAGKTLGFNAGGLGDKY